jgi:hypothetical protein
MSGKKLDNSWDFDFEPTGWETPQNVERPDCHHMVTIMAYVKNGAIPHSEREKIDAQLSQPCQQCAKESLKHDNEQTTV